MKVTFCTFDVSNYINGPNAWLRRILAELQNRGFQCQVMFVALAPEEKCTTLACLRQEGFDCVVIPASSTEHRVRWILEKLAEDPPDVFVPNLMVPAFYASRWVREAGIPTVGVLHSDDDYYGGILSEFVFEESAYQLSGIACVSRVLEQEVLKQHPPRTLVRRLPYGAPIPARVAQPPNQKLRIAYVGRLVEEQKRISAVVRVLCRTVQEIPDTEAVIYGSGPDYSTVEQILSNEGTGLPVRLAGRVDSERMQEHLLACHVIVLLSDYEGLPVALMEAMACGVVPICLDIRSGIPELVEDGVTGLLVSDRGDSFVAAVQRLRHESGLWEQLSQQARAKIQTEYSNEVCAAYWENFLQELHQTSGPRCSIKVPSHLNLPPVSPIFISHDYREPSIYTRFLQSARICGGGVKSLFINKVMQRGH